MSKQSDIYNKLSSRSGGRGEVAEVQLAQDLAQQADPQSILALVQGLQSKDKHLQADCIKTLYEVGYRDPAQIAPYAENFLALLSSTNNRLVWGAMIALSTIADRTASFLLPHLSLIEKTMEDGSVISRDAGMSVLAGIASASEGSAKEVMPIVLDWLQNCRPRSVAQYAERAMPVVQGAWLDPYLTILRTRESDLNATQLARLRRIYKKLGGNNGNV